MFGVEYIVRIILRAKYDRGQNASTATDRDIGNYKTIGEEGKKGEHSD